MHSKGGVLVSPDIKEAKKKVQMIKSFANYMGCSKFILKGKNAGWFYCADTNIDRRTTEGKTTYKFNIENVIKKANEKISELKKGRSPYESELEEARRDIEEASRISSGTKDALTRLRQKKIMDYLSQKIAYYQILMG